MRFSGAPVVPAFCPDNGLRGLCWGSSPPLTAIFSNPHQSQQRFSEPSGCLALTEVLAPSVLFGSVQEGVSACTRNLMRGILSVFL